jgi:O-antigen/teichoic acid export membrane protein
MISHPPVMLNKFFKDSSIYTLPKLISIGINFIVLPIYTRILTPYEYGIVEMITITYSLLNFLLTLEIHQGMARHLPDAKSDTEKTGYVSTGFWFSISVYLVFIILCFLFPHPLAHFLLGGQTDNTIFYFAIFIICSSAFVYQLKNILRWNLKAKAWAVTTIVGAIVSHSFSVLLITFFKLGLAGYLLGSAIGLSAAFLSGLYSTQKSSSPIRLVFENKKLRNMLSFSLPLVFSSAASYITLYTDRWMLNMMLGIEDVGIYSVAFRIATAITILIVGFQQALSPLVFHHYQNDETPKHIADIFRFFLLLTFPAVAFLSAFSKEILAILVGVNFFEAHLLLPWLAFALVILNVYIFAPGMGLTKKTKKIAVANICAATVNILLNLVLIRLYGRIGAVFATLGGGITMASMYFVWSSMEYQIPYTWKRFLVATLLLTCFMTIISSSDFHLMLRLLLWVITVGSLGKILLKIGEFSKMKNFLQVQFAK